MGEGREGPVHGEWGQSQHPVYTIPYHPCQCIPLTSVYHTIPSRRLLRPHSIVPSHGIVFYMASPRPILVVSYHWCGMVLTSYGIIPLVWYCMYFIVQYHTIGMALNGIIWPRMVSYHWYGMVLASLSTHCVISAAADCDLTLPLHIYVYDMIRLEYLIQVSP